MPRARLSSGVPASADPLELPATPGRIRAAARGAGLADRALDRALRIATATPSSDAWRRFLSRALALLGAGLLLAGVICFVAYNWSRIGRFGKFALIDAGIIGATLVGWRMLPRLSGQLALFAAAVLVGALLAVYGQTYQTGADPYGLFLTWSWLIIPWVIAAHFSALWVLELALLDMSLVLFYTQVIGFDRLNEALVLPLDVAGLHAIALVGWEWQIRRARPWLDEEWAPHAVAAVGYLALVIAAAVAVLADREAGVPGIVGLVALGIAIAGAYHYYRRLRPDRFMVTVAVAAGMTWVAFVVGRVLFEELKLDMLGFFLMALFLIAEITVGLRWFRGSRQRAQGAEV
jgi:uncharacterized membrane protein